MNLKLLLVPVLLFTNLTPLFAQENILTQYLPAKTNLVISVNPLRLISKIPGESFRQSGLYRELMKNPSSPVNVILTNPTITGIDYSSGIVIFSVVDPEGSSKPRMHVMGRLLQPAQFEKLCSDVGGESKMSTEGTNKMMLGENGGVAWNDKVFVFTGGGSDDVSYVNYPEDTSMAAIETWERDRKEKAIKKLKETSLDLLMEKNQNGFSGDPKFVEFMSKTADLKFWSNGQGSEIPSKLFPMGDLLRELQAFTAGTKIAYVNFENGKVIAQTHNYLKGGLGDIYSKYPPTPQNQELLKKLPHGKLLGLINISYNNEMGKELLQTGVFKELLDSARKYIPFDFNKLSEVFKYNIMLAVLQTDENNKKEGIEFILAMPIADQARFDELSKSVKHVYDSLKKTEPGEKSKKKFEPIVKSGNGLFVLSLSEKTADAFLSNPGTQPVPSSLEAFSRYPFIAHVNLREIISTIFANPKVSSDEKMEGMKSVLGIFDQVIAYGGEYKDGSVSSTLELHLADQNKNSLHQLFDFVNTMAEKKPRPDVDMNNVDENVKEEKKVIEITKEEQPINPPPPPPPAEVKKPVKKKKN